MDAGFLENPCQEKTNSIPGPGMRGALDSIPDPENVHGPMYRILEFNAVRKHVANEIFLA